MPSQKPKHVFTCNASNLAARANKTFARSDRNNKFYEQEYAIKSFPPYSPQPPVRDRNAASNPIRISEVMNKEMRF